MTRLEEAIELYRQEKVSQEVAANRAGLSRSAFLDELCKAKVSPFQYTAEDLIQEAELIKKYLKRRRKDRRMTRQTLETALNALKFSCKINSDYLGVVSSGIKRGHATQSDMKKAQAELEAVTTAITEIEAALQETEQDTP